MFQFSADTPSIVGLLGAISSLVTATAALIWACRRDPQKPK